MTNRRSFALFTVLAFGYAFLYLPIVSLIVYSFNASRLVTVWGGFSTRWYGELLRNEQLLAAAWLSLRIAFSTPRARYCSAPSPASPSPASAASAAGRCSPSWSTRRW